MSKQTTCWLSGLASLVAVSITAAADMPPVSAAVSKADSAAWAAIAKLPDFWTGTWQGISPMVDGKVNVSYTPKAVEFMKHYKPVMDIDYAAAGCKTPGMPMVMQIAAMPLKFMVEPGMIAIYIEGNSQTRFIFMNRKHSDPVDPSYLGESVGHWEGDTLVVDTIGFNDETTFQYGVRQPSPGEKVSLMSGILFGPHGPNLRMIERMHLKDSNTLEIQNTIHDDSVFTTPYVTTRIWKRHTGEHSQPMEWVCSENINVFDPKTNTHVVTDPH